MSLQHPTANTVTANTVNPCPAGLRPGRYRHYKGQDYEVFGLVRHSETEEWLVHYRTLYGDFSHWVRPYRMFIETIDVEGKAVARFDYLGPIELPSKPDTLPVEAL